MARRRTDRELLAEALDVLERVDCQFFACEGPFRPQTFMVTCVRCSTIYTLRRRLKLSVRSPANRARREEDDTIAVDVVWRREIAMEAGMLHGIDAHNDAMGCSLEPPEEG